MTTIELVPNPFNFGKNGIKTTAHLSICSVSYRCGGGSRLGLGVSGGMGGGNRGRGLRLRLFSVDIVEVVIVKVVIHHQPYAR